MALSAFRFAAALGLAGFLTTGCDDGDSTPRVADAEVDMRRLSDVATMPDATDMAVESDMAPSDDLGPTPDAGDDRPPCEARANLGLRAWPTPIADPQTFAPDALWNGTEYGVSWQTPGGPAGLDIIRFQRFNRTGEAVGQPAEIGYAELPQHAVAYNGTNFLVAWIARRTADTVFDGLRIRPLDAAGNAGGVTVDLPLTFDARQMDFAWAPLGGGMLVYTRGLNGEGGVWAIALDEGLNASPAVQLTQSPAQSPAVAFGDGVWGAAWLARDGDDPNELAFRLLNDQGTPIGDEARVGGGGIGNVQMAFGEGMGVFGVAWTKPFGAGIPQPAITLVDGAGDPFATPPLPGATGAALITDVAFLAPDRFAIAWHQTLPGGARQLGISRITPQGLISEPVALPLPEGHSHQGLVLGGTLTRFTGWYTDDPMPGPVGYSDQTTVHVGQFGPCGD
ncbi:MAG: hypothetical protein KC620_11115 [Myxococcales bacterium]|nr:hypothetical protein [Myxococcales bacterium]